MLKSVISTVLISIFSNASHACSCGLFYNSFKQAFNNELSVLVIHGKVLSYPDMRKVYPKRVKKYPWLYQPSKNGRPPEYMEVEVINILKGGTKKSTLYIRGDNGTQCMRYVTSFPIDTEWLFALTSENGSVNSCGEFAIKVEDSNVSGFIDIERGVNKKQQHKPLNEVYEILGIPNHIFKRDYLR